jgi:phosphoenolpyruvate synthase/pyruvate phosphate dikinase
VSAPVQPAAVNPLHNPGGPRTAWSVANTAENFPGVATPLGWSFWRDTHERSIRGAMADFGVMTEADVHTTDIADDRLSTVFFGRFTGNVDRLRWIADHMPGSSGSDIELQIFGSVRADVQDNPSRRRYPMIAVKMPQTIRRLPALMRAQRAETDAWWRAGIRPGSVATIDTAQRKLREASERFELMLRAHNCASLWASALYGQLATVAAVSGNPGLETALVSGYGGMEETESIADLWEVSRDRLSMDAFIARHGYHAPVEAELASLSWREDPSPAHARAQMYRAKDEASSPERLERRQRNLRLEAERRVLGALSAPRRPGARLLMKLASRYVPLREKGKANFVQCLDVGRAAARSLGHHLVASGNLADPGDVYFLTLDEVTGVLPPDVGAVVGLRRTTYEEYASFEIPQFWIGTPEPIREPPPGSEVAANGVTGIPISPGVVEGTARVMQGPDSGELEDGEILVCHTTDPSWASLFLATTALVIDIGGPMSHGAIVAREMGIPCVINTGDGTRVVGTGDRVRVDGGTGKVEILARA